MFFVISGYLITSIIYNEKKDGVFSIVNFYERRARRILPALFFVVIVCVFFSWVLPTPEDIKNSHKVQLQFPLFLPTYSFG